MNLTKIRLIWGEEELETTTFPSTNLYIKGYLEGLQRDMLENYEAIKKSERTLYFEIEHVEKLKQAPLDIDIFDEWIVL